MTSNGSMGQLFGYKAFSQHGTRTAKTLRMPTRIASRSRRHLSVCCLRPCWIACATTASLSARSVISSLRRPSKQLISSGTPCRRQIFSRPRRRTTTRNSCIGARMRKTAAESERWQKKSAAIKCNTAPVAPATPVCRSGRSSECKPSVASPWEALTPQTESRSRLISCGCLDRADALSPFLRRWYNCCLQSRTKET